MLNHAVLSAAEERAAFTHYRELRDEHGPEDRRTLAARNALVLSNMRLVAKVACRLRGLTREERIQEGAIGLVTACERFDLARGVRFSTYAAWWIRHAIGRAVADTGRTVRLPVHRLEQQARAAKAGECIDDGVALEHQGLSLDAPLGVEDGGTWYDFTASPGLSPEELAGGAEEHRLARKLVDELEPEARTIVERRYGLDGRDESTLAEVGATLRPGRASISRERVRQLEQDAIGQLRELVA